MLSSFRPTDPLTVIRHCGGAGPDNSNELVLESWNLGILESCNEAEQFIPTLLIGQNSPISNTRSTTYWFIRLHDKWVV